MSTATNTRPAAYDDFCECGHRIGMHVQLDNNYAPCSAGECSCDDYDERTVQVGRSDPTPHTLSNFRVEYVKPDYSRGHSFEPRCAILADAAEFDGKTVRVFDVPDPDESQREIAQFACEAMNERAGLKDSRSREGSMSFTLEQMLLADELLFPETFERLMRKHSDLTSTELCLAVHYYAVYQKSLFVLLKSIPRSRKKELAVLTAVIADLLRGDYLRDVE